MKVEIRNIGPINRAAIDLDGLAILVGPNASGKTTLSTICYAVLRSYRQAVHRLLLPAAAVARRVRTPVPEGDRAEAAVAFAYYYCDTLAVELQRCFSVDLAKLPRRGRGGAGSAPRILVTDSGSGLGSWALAFRIGEDRLYVDTEHASFRLPSIPPPAHTPSSAVYRARGRVSRLSLRLADPIYFPAGRSGYVQMQTVLSSLLIAALGRGQFDQLSLGKISGIAADFLELVADISPARSSPFAPLAQRLETELIRGRLKLTSIADGPNVLQFAPEGIAEYWPMDATATSTVEIAPLLLYLRHRARPADLVFIDEPEAHLHPHNQVVLADVLLAMSSMMRGMVVGTHSDYFATGVSNSLVRRHAAGTDDAAAVVLYELVEAATTGGYETVVTSANPQTGFAVDQFAAVGEAVLDEAQSLFELAQRS